MMYDHEKSDPAIVAVKPTNKAGQPAAELVEPRAGAEGNVSQQSTGRAQYRGTVSKALKRIRNFVRISRNSVCASAPLTRFPGTVPGPCFADSHSPRPPPLAPPTPQPVARLCSSASQLLWRGQTSHDRTSSATAPRLPDAGQCSTHAGAGRP